MFFYARTSTVHNYFLYFFIVLRHVVLYVNAPVDLRTLAVQKQYTVPMISAKVKCIKIYIHTIWIDPLGCKFQTDTKNFCKSSIWLQKVYNLGFKFRGNEYREFYNCMGKACLNLNRQREKYRPLGRCNSQLWMNDLLLIFFALFAHIEVLFLKVTVF
jgi:hypothetical protein